MTADNRKMKKARKQPSGRDSRVVDPLGKRFGAIIRDARERRKLSQTDLAKALGVSRQAVNMWEAGVNLPGVRRWDQISKLLDLTPYRVGEPYPVELSEERSLEKSIPMFFTRPTPEPDRFLLDTEGV